MQAWCVDGAGSPVPLSGSGYADFIHVTVRDGVVTLRGSVEDQRAVEAAIHNAKEAGAKKVINKLTTEEGH